MPETPPRATAPTQAEYLTFGGMAVVEGVMMRSPNHWAVACRAPNGQIVVRTEPLAKTWIGRQQWLKKPFLRGTLAMLDTMALGVRAMNVAGNVQTEAKYQPLNADGTAAEAAKPTSKTVDTLVIAATVVVSLALGFLLFNAAPQFVAEYIVRFSTGSPDVNRYLTATNYLAEVVKVVFVIAYLALISRLPAIFEVFKYHGAEHKAINTVEAREELNAENCMAQTRLHPRCGTNFVIIVTLVSFLLFPAIPRDLFVSGNSPGWLIALTRLPVELAMLPVVAGISYEVIRAAGKAKDQRWVNVILKPGLLTQLITTAEPDRPHVDVAIASLKAVMKAEDTGELTETDDFENQQPTPVPAPA